jgi:hypothetical protein
MAVIEEVVRIEVEAAKASVKELEKTVRDLEERFNRLNNQRPTIPTGDGLKDASFQARNLRAQLADIGVQLAGGQNPLLILIQQGPQIAESFAGGASAINVLKAAFGGLLPILAPIGAAVVALGGAWYYYSSQLDKANEKAAKAAELATKAQGAHQDIADTLQEVSDNYRLATGQANELTLKQEESDRIIREGYEKQLTLSRELVSAKRTELDAAQKTATAIQESLSKAKADPATRQDRAYMAQLANDAEQASSKVNKLNNEMESQQSILVQQQMAMDNAMATNRRSLAILDEKEQREREAASALKDRAKAESDAAKELREAEALMRDTLKRGIFEMEQQFAEFSPSLDALVAWQNSALALIGETNAKIIGETQLAMDAWGIEFNAAWDQMVADAQARVERLGSIANTISTFSSGSAESMLALAGPGGQVAGSVFGAVSGFADRSNSTADQLKSGLMGFAKGLANIGSELGDLILGVAQDFVPTLLKNIPLLVASLIDTLADPKLWIEVAKALVKGVWDAIKEIFDIGRDLGEAIGNLFKRKSGKNRASGGWINEDGWYHLEKDERITQRGQPETSGQNSRVHTGEVGASVAGRVPVYIDVQQLAREINRQSARGVRVS